MSGTGPSPPSPGVSGRSPAASPRGVESGRGPPREPRRRDRNRDREFDAFEDARLTTSTLLAAGVGLVAVLMVGVAADEVTAAVLAVVGGVGFAVATGLLADGDPVRVAVGTLLGVAGACCLVGGAAVGPTPLFGVLALAAFASAATPTASVGHGRLMAALGIMVYCLVPVGIVAVAAVLVGAAGSLSGVTAGLVSPTGLGGNLVTFVFLVAATLLAVRSAFRRLPVVHLTPKPDRDRMRARLDRLDGALSRALWAMAAVVPVTLLVVVFLQSDQPALRSALSPVGALTGTSLVRLPLLALAVLGSAVAATAGLIRWAGGSVVDLTSRGIAAAVGLGLTVLVVAAHGPAFSAAVDGLDPATASTLREFAASIGSLSTILVGICLAVIGFGIAMLVVPMGVGLGLAPDRAAAPAFGAGGLLLGAALAVEHVPPLVVLSTVVAGMVVWDLGEFGVGVREEVGDAPASRAEAIHAAGSLGVGAAVLAGATGLHLLVSRVSFRGTTAVAALVAAFVGVVLLEAVLRG